MYHSFAQFFFPSNNWDKWGKMNWHQDKLTNRNRIIYYTVFWFVLILLSLKSWKPALKRKNTTFLPAVASEDLSPTQPRGMFGFFDWKIFFVGEKNKENRAFVICLLQEQVNSVRLHLFLPWWLLKATLWGGRKRTEESERREINWYKLGFSFLVCLNWKFKWWFQCLYSLLH